jgi:enoyl-CoA hydratase/carnithine racemase
MIETLRHGDVLELRLARPPVNAIDPGLVRALTAAIEGAPGSGARALVLSGQPGRFSGGLDVPALLALERPETERFLGEFLALLRTLALSEIPVSAAITGHAPAGGAVLAIHCDQRVMAEGDFRIGLNEVQVGIPLPGVLFSTLERVVGTRQAERLAVGGLMLTSGEALAIGLVDELVPVEGVVERALQVARDWLALPPRAMAKTRALARRELAEIYAREERATWETFVEDWFSAETQATLRALVEKLHARGREGRTEAKR